MRMKEFFIGLGMILWLGLLTPVVQAATIWSEDFSDVSDWSIISDPGGGSTITASGGLGAMHVDKGKDIAAFAPNPEEANFIPFNPANKSEYTLKWKIAHLTWSVSWDIAVDEFDSNKKYIDTVWNIYPALGSTTETGVLSKKLGDKTWSAKTRYIIPKINVHTGDPNQTVHFDYMKVDRTPKRPF